ncbi:BamA/TamA family outer membrane protein [Flavobacterium ustbae]|uniref:BamA/TamA family outer membrane protein n=1 Tax=Flavobacterium ustbae TaxID=2488790 RepID=UPI000F78B4D7|nr:BamA/TamA family outer membrane protein [Flavobacterium ustbae]
MGTRDILDVIHKIFDKQDTIRPERKKKLTFSLLPVPVGVNSSNGLVVSFLTTFYLGDAETTKMSQITFSPYFSFSKQFVFPIQSYIYSKDNKWNLIGDYRYMIYPQDTYGLGEHESEKEMSTLDYQQWRFYQFITRKIVGNYRLGVGFLLDNYQNISEESYIDGETDYYQYMNGDYSNETSFGFAIQGLYDSRENIINPKEGLYVEADLRINTSGVEGDKWQSLYFDARKYHSFSTTKHRVWASRAFYWSTFGGKPHYLDLPSIGWDREGKTGRGFTKNRYRSNALIYFETEYRTDISRNGFFGAVFFTNISSVSKLDTYQFKKWNPAVGTGIRIKWNKRNGSNLALDYGISKNDWSLRLGLSENF